uniref:hypothetical protein n=1 Tax=Streptomyces polyasparticus TaxID=2767826 RepID=UPI001F3E3E46|nr:hypothetical protein [Streptomyces polyasparticus]
MNVSVHVLTATRQGNDVVHVDGRSQEGQTTVRALAMAHTLQSTSKTNGSIVAPGDSGTALAVRLH